jgi:hypothetical protein
MKTLENYNLPFTASGITNTKEGIYYHCRRFITFYWHHSCLSGNDLSKEKNY